MTNPLLDAFILPPFTSLKAAYIEPAVDTVLDENRRHIAELLETNAVFTWQTLVEPLEMLDNRFNRMWSPVSHLNSVMNNDEWREAYSNCLPKLSEYSTEIGQNKALYSAYLSIKEGDEYKTLDVAQQKIIDNTLRDFELSGVALPENEKQQYKDISQQLSTLTNQFEENLMDATHAWEKHVLDRAELAGLPDSTMGLLKQTAQQQNKEGWLLNLEFPCYMAVMMYADNRALRYEIYRAYVTRASELGASLEWDNSSLMDAILKLRHEKAQLLGFDSYAHLSIATKMAETPDDVIAFLNELAKGSKSMAKNDFSELCSFAKDHGHEENVEAWDMSYFSEKLRQDRYQFSEEDVKPYFPADKVLAGMFLVINKLYGMTVVEEKGVDTWHPDVRFFSIYDEHDVIRGQFFTDLYARPHKRGGAWMDECTSRFKSAGQVQIPVAYLTCNFTPAVGDDPSLLTHNEVETLFHEFGHGLHHMLTQVDYLSVSGIHGVEWDAVELPSQFMENWCWQPEVIAMISEHYQTGERLPDVLFKKMLAAKNFQSGMQMLRQIEFSLFDFRIHLEYDPEKASQIYPILEQVRADISVLSTPDFNRFPNSFSHIFAGGYAAGYYSYKWAEVLSSDAFSLFEERGVFDEKTGRLFLENILEKGGSEDALELFVSFRGRKPTIDALLKHSGIAV